MYFYKNLLAPYSDIEQVSPIPISNSSASHNYSVPISKIEVGQCRRCQLFESNNYPGGNIQYRKKINSEQAQNKSTMDGYRYSGETVIRDCFKKPIHLRYNECHGVSYHIDPFLAQRSRLEPIHRDHFNEVHAQINKRMEYDEMFRKNHIRRLHQERKDTTQKLQKDIENLRIEYVLKQDELEKIRNYKINNIQRVPVILLKLRNMK